MRLIGLGTIVNTVAIIIGGLIGVMLKKGISDTMKDSVLKTMGICVSFMGIGSFISKFLVVSDNVLITKNFMLVVISLTLGVIVGELIDIEEKFDRFALLLKKITKNHNDSNFVDGFITTSIIFCVGAMSILGAIQDGINSDPSILYTKSVLDGVSVIIFSAMYGRGAIFSALSVFIYQGIITLFSFSIHDYVTPKMLDNISLVGSIMIFCIGVNVFANLKIRVGNQLPALIFVIIFTLFNIF